MANYGSFMYGRNGRFYARLRVPKQFQAAYAKTHLWVSLDTSDIAMARLRVHEVVLRCGDHGIERVMLTKLIRHAGDGRDVPAQSAKGRDDQPSVLARQDQTPSSATRLGDHEHERRSGGYELPDRTKADYVPLRLWQGHQVSHEQHARHALQQR